MTFEGMAVVACRACRVCRVMVWHANTATQRLIPRKSLTGAAIPRRDTLGHATATTYFSPAATTSNGLPEVGLRSSAAARSTADRSPISGSCVGVSHDVTRTSGSRPNVALRERGDVHPCVYAMALHVIARYDATATGVSPWRQGRNSRFTLCSSRLS